MGKVKCKMRVERFKWKRSGYAEVMNSSAVQSLLRKPAKGLANACNADFDRKRGERVGYRAKRIQGKLANGWVVKTASKHAHASERKHNRLKRGLGGS